MYINREAHIPLLHFDIVMQCIKFADQEIDCNYVMIYDLKVQTAQLCFIDFGSR